jgi:exodeoxyribonuclease VII small subunit
VPQKSKKNPKSMAFEEALSELEALVNGLESGDQPLEESLAQFERGISLARHCQHSLKTAEQKVQVLMKQSDGADALVDLDAADEAD